MSWPKCSCKDKVWKIETLPASFQHSEIKCSCSQRTIRLDVSTYAKKKLQARNGKCPIQRHHQFWFPAVLVSPHHDIALQWNQWKEISKLKKSNRWGYVWMVDANRNVVALTGPRTSMSESKELHCSHSDTWSMKYTNHQMCRLLNVPFLCGRRVEESDKNIESWIPWWPNFFFKYL